MLNAEVQEQILELRKKGYGYKSIASCLKIPRDTVRNVCRKYGLTGYGMQIIRDIPEPEEVLKQCLYCGKEINTKEQRGRKAEGTEYWRGGLTWVGEKGPELIELPRGSKVFSNEKSMDMISGNKGNPSSNNSNLTIHIDNFNNNTDKDIEQLAYELEFYRQRVAMGRGGA